MFPRPVRACRSIAGRLGTEESGGAFGPGPVRSPDFAGSLEKILPGARGVRRNLTIGKRQGLLQLFDSGIAAGGRRTVAVRMESRLSGLSRASVKFCMSGRSCPARGGCDLRHLVRARGRLAFRGPHPIAPMNSASCRRFAGSGTSAALRQRSACTICGNVPETSHSLPERSLVSVRIRPSNSSSVRSCRPPVDRLPTACGSLQMPTSLPSAEAGSATMFRRRPFSPRCPCLRKSGSFRSIPGALHQGRVLRSVGSKAGTVRAGIRPCFPKCVFC